MLEQSSEAVVPELGLLEQGMSHEMLDRLEKMLGRHAICDSRCVSNIGDITAFVKTTEACLFLVLKSRIGIQERCCEKLAPACKTHANTSSERHRRRCCQRHTAGSLTQLATAGATTGSNKP